MGGGVHDGRSGSGSTLPLLSGVAFGLVLAAFGMRAWLIQAHAFNPDEFQHLHGAFCLFKGMLPYRDFFEHHTPLLTFFLAPFLSFFEVERDANQAVAFIFFARGWMWIFSGAILLLTFRLAKLWRGVRTAWMATVFLSMTVMFYDSTLEIRPDVPALGFLLGSWVTMLLALRSEPSGARLRLFAASGAMQGMAILCTQKVLFTLPATALLLLLHAYERRGSEPLRSRLGNALFYAFGLVTPITLALAYFASREGLLPFVDCNLLVNLRWKHRFSPAPMFRRLILENPGIVALGLCGLGTAALGMRRRQATLKEGDLLLALNAVGLLGGAFLIPIPYPQYFLMLLPLVAILGAGFATERVHRLMAPREGRAPEGALVVLLVLLSAGPLSSMVAILHPTRDKVHEQIEKLRFVLANTAPDETVMDGFSGLGVFRPHAYFYFFLHEEIRALLDAGEMERLLMRLRNGVIAPKLVVMDEDLSRLPPAIVAFLKANYEIVGEGPLFKLKDLWVDDPEIGGQLDLGQGSTDGLAGQGWYPPENEGETSFRASRGRHSGLRLPVRRPGAFVVTVRGRLEYAAAPVRVSFVVNDLPIGEARLAPGWTDYTFRVPAGVLRAGINRVAFSYSLVPREAGPGYAGRNSVMSVDYVLLAREGDH